MSFRLKITLSIISAAILALLLFFAFAFPSGGPDMAQGAMPWEGYIRFTSADYFRYAFRTLTGMYSDYPWVVKVSYYVVVLSCIAVLFLIYVISWDVAVRQRDRAFLDHLRSRYRARLESVVAGGRLMDDEALVSAFSPDIRDFDRPWKRILWIDFFIDFLVNVQPDAVAVQNISGILRIYGFDDFMEDRLANGKDSERMKVIQAVRILGIGLSDSVTARLVNSRNEGLRKASRFYYMMTSDDDPYRYFEKGQINDEFTDWDRLEMHYLMENCISRGRRLPSFIPLLRQSASPSVMSFLIRETMYWGSEKEASYIANYFSSDDPELRRAAFESMSVRKLPDAVKSMTEVYYDQTESLKRVILLSLLSSSEEGAYADFFRDAYLDTASFYTKRVALYCLLHSGPDAKPVFDSLKEVAGRKEAALFRHVECAMIKS